VIQVDQKTGITQVVNPLKDKELTANEAVKNFFVIQYIRSRESYDVNNLEYDYNVVRVMSEPETVYHEFLRERSKDNPDSPTNKLQAYGTRRVSFKSISYINPTAAQVRLQITETLGNNSKVMHKIALVTFEYTNLELTPEERNINPLGFIVTNYRLDEDALPQ
jgi:type IV secretion system protein VirB8